jgi:hypothetical protein
LFHNANDVSIIVARKAAAWFLEAAWTERLAWLDVKSKEVFKCLLWIDASHFLEHADGRFVRR